jgi:hypothetical protein
MTQRVYRSAQQWQSLIKQFDQSQTSAEAFCEQHDLGLKSFHHWRYRFSAHIKRRAKQKAFVELKPSVCPTLNTATMSLHVGDAVRLDLPTSMPTDQLVQLLKAVARA